MKLLLPQTTTIAPFGTTLDSWLAVLPGGAVGSRSVSPPLHSLMRGEKLKSTAQIRLIDALRGRALMDRFRWCSDQVEHHGFGGSGGVDEESLVLQQTGIRLYDGPNRTSFDHGVIKLTTHRLIWTRSDAYDSTSVLALPLAAILSVRIEEGGGLVRGRSPKVVLRLLTPAALYNALASLPNPLPWTDRWLANGNRKTVAAAAENDQQRTSTYSALPQSSENHVKLGFTRTGHREFERALQEVLAAKVWAASVIPTRPGNSSRAYGSVGIGAIEKQQAARIVHTDKSLEEAFDDLNNLMSRAREMVALSRALAKKSRVSKGGELTTNETAELRAAMLSMGVMDDSDVLNSRSSNETVRGSSAAAPTASSSSSFHAQLAHQLSDLLTPLLTGRKGSTGVGCVDLASAYCRLNRARGMQLVSPEDLLRSCHLLEREKLPIRLKRFPSGLMVLQLASENESETLQSTAALIQERSSLTAEELSRIVGVPLLLARERLLAVEEVGLVCRDDSLAGLRFYPNRFVTES
ncbi:Vacuolar protein-sorting-associated protein 36 [Fasciola hepatica]|uniref:Vacuolar protein-sorting-associated protein 36 n=1 Tax=Fasciola hepatica TaxID=6192 RepID=A0A4E0R5E0_FASHE|nr:Vacuolar protein-sorting-associated protein 36 [Fasciola hepatica]